MNTSVVESDLYIPLEIGCIGRTKLECILMVHKLCFLFYRTWSMEMFGAASVSVSQLGLMEVSTEQTSGLQDVFFPHDRFLLFFWCLGSLAGKNPPR